MNKFPGVTENPSGLGARVVPDRGGHVRVLVQTPNPPILTLAIETAGDRAYQHAVTRIRMAHWVDGHAADSFDVHIRPYSGGQIDPGFEGVNLDWLASHGIPVSQAFAKLSEWAWDYRPLPVWCWRAAETIQFLDRAAKAARRSCWVPPFAIDLKDMHNLIYSMGGTTIQPFSLQSIFAHWASEAMDAEDPCEQIGHASDGMRRIVTLCPQ